MLPTWMYSKSADALYVNLFAGSRVSVGQVAGTDVEVVQETDYPWDGAVRITLNPKAPARFAVRIRAPRRDVSSLYRAVPAADGIIRVTVNGAAVKAVEANGYLEVARAWKRGDTIEFDAADADPARLRQRPHRRRRQPAVAGEREGRAAPGAARLQHRAGRPGHQRRAPAGCAAQPSGGRTFSRA